MGRWQADVPCVEDVRLVVESDFHRVVGSGGENRRSAADYVEGTVMRWSILEHPVLANAR
jgi:hypothetical protein